MLRLGESGYLPAIDPLGSGMDIHKPKPWHGLREFLKEYLIIVVGVLTALGAEQLVSNFDWSRKVAETRDALGLELAENLGKAENRIKFAPCTDQRLDALAVIVDRAAQSGALPPLPVPTEPPYYSWGSGVWSSALSSQAASHLPAEQLRGYGRFYQILDRISGAEPREEEAWTALFGLAGPGRPFDAEDARTYRRAIGQARQLNGLIAGFGIRLKQVVEVNHIPYDSGMYDERTASLKTDHPICGAPTGEPPASYGAAPATHFVEHAIEHPTR